MERNCGRPGCHRGGWHSRRRADRPG